MARKGKRLKEEGPRYEESQLLNRVAGEVLKDLLERARRAGGPTTSLGTSAWLADGMGISPSTLSRMLSGRHSLTFENIWFAADVLGVRPIQLVAVIEDAMRRILALELAPSELVERVVAGDGEQLDDLLREQLTAAIEESEDLPELWELVPEGAAAAAAEAGAITRWTRMLGSGITAPLVGSVLGIAAGVAATKFFGSDED